MRVKVVLIGVDPEPSHVFDVEDDVRVKTFERLVRNHFNVGVELFSRDQVLAEFGACPLMCFNIGDGSLLFAKVSDLSSVLLVSQSGLTRRVPFTLKPWFPDSSGSSSERETGPATLRHLYYLAERLCTVPRDTFRLSCRGRYLMNDDETSLEDLGLEPDDLVEIVNRAKRARECLLLFVDATSKIDCAVELIAARFAVSVLQAVPLSASTFMVSPGSARSETKAFLLQAILDRVSGAPLVIKFLEAADLVFSYLPRGRGLPVDDADLSLAGGVAVFMRIGLASLAVNLMGLSFQLGVPRSATIAELCDLVAKQAPLFICPLTCFLPADLARLVMAYALQSIQPDQLVCYKAERQPMFLRSVQYATPLLPHARVCTEIRNEGVSITIKGRCHVKQTGLELLTLSPVKAIAKGSVRLLRGNKLAPRHAHLFDLGLLEFWPFGPATPTACISDVEAPLDSVVITTPGAMELRLPCTANTMISDLKCELKRKLGVRDYALRLVWAGRTLDNKKTLGQYGIREDCTILLLLEFLPSY